MNRKTCLLLLVAIHCVLASDHSLVKRQTSDTTNTVSETNRLTQFLSNTWDTLRGRFNTSQSQTRIRQFHSNLTTLRQNLVNASGDAAQEAMTRLQNMAQSLNNLMRDRVNSDKTLVNRLYGMINNGTAQSGQSADTLRQAWTSATRTMAENYSGLANSSIQLATDLISRGRNMFDDARIRAGNDTNRAVKAVNTAIEAIRNSSQPVNQTLQQVAADLAQSAQRLSAGLRTLMNQTSSAAETSVQTVTSDEFRQKAEQSLQKLLTNMNRLRDSVARVTDNTANNLNENLENNEIIQNVSTSLTNEYEALQNQIAELRRRANVSS